MNVIPPNRRSVLKGITSSSLATAAVPFSTLNVQANSPNIHTSQIELIEYTVEIKNHEEFPEVAYCPGLRQYHIDEGGDSSSRVVFTEYHDDFQATNGTVSMALSSREPILGSQEIRVTLKDAITHETPGSGGQKIPHQALDATLTVRKMDSSVVVTMEQNEIRVRSNNTEEMITKTTMVGKKNRTDVELKVTVRYHGDMIVLTHPNQILFPLNDRMENVTDRISESVQMESSERQGVLAATMHRDHNVIGLSKMESGS